MLGDCLERMKEIPDGSVDMILADPPYGTTACKWDSIIPLEPMWEQLKRVIKPNGAIVLFGAEPFSSALRMSNIKNYKYDIVWDKMKAGLFMLAKKRILPSHENIILFSYGINTYNPQMTVKPKKDRRPKRKDDETSHINDLGGPKRKHSKDYREDLKYPTSIVAYSKEMAECNNTKRIHPTQKPVALMEYLIKTYTNEGETVLDFCIGSGSTGVAAKNLNRKFIGIEKDETYFKIAQDRINAI